jgi:hypothetical protein
VIIQTSNIPTTKKHRKETKKKIETHTKLFQSPPREEPNLFFLLEPPDLFFFFSR